ncbi:hypothetical protein Poly41_42010 [Novipirellula artificiosorum]|uniref:Uncharacterized protein n=1 Tax=Novipirellula artificiosorum TaxID=2528016 RepID=A0A5C6DGV2_9BACT|nr:hypothetical protein Poly41_42010 [Novipirellula artificiosorum]
MSNHCWQELFSLVIVQLPGETESSSAEVQLDKGYPGRRCPKGATGSLRTTVRRALFSKRSLDTGAIPPKNLESGFRALPSDEEEKKGSPNPSRPPDASGTWQIRSQVDTVTKRQKESGEIPWNGPTQITLTRVVFDTVVPIVSIFDPFSNGPAFTL